MDKKALIKQYLTVIAGGFLFSASVNLFIVPLGLYSGGVIGSAQIFRTILVNYLKLDIFNTFDVAGIINFIINIPLFIIAFKSISKRFFVKTMLCMIVQTLAFSLIPIPQTPIIDDTLASCLIGGIVGGFGIGIALRSGGSGGGLDILGVYVTKKFHNFSVGKLALLVNAVVYTICALLFNLSTAIYSIIYMVFFTTLIDKTHYQNISVACMIFSKNKNIQEDIMRETGRGVTHWTGEGAYTKTGTNIMLTMINKYEINQIKRIIEKNDPKAFAIFEEAMSVTGNFEKRL